MKRLVPSILMSMRRQADKIDTDEMDSNVPDGDDDKWGEYAFV